ncbi:pilus assembly protein TadG-related protein [Paraburkholderia phymatum]|uniref:Uncharacterized protein n=1 Tax=Paraburkholderia phymatum (strain DSM 17167 / CIP 108236 / LMG 21445 / STM815) TaxID=391038 RepID=B2JQB4_PARP8|nr:pilus assembly protein TadG-related protein [Paraburkholderia phymatum]ACC73455.1 conserved hypothetical protein [Paraburkholderia phymatum STM815]
MKRTSRRRSGAHAGQALVPALLFLLIGGVGLYVAFGSFQMTSAKIKLQNTADAAAYSAAVLQARDYNFSAYANRAMVANQVSAAQIVALKSWIDELDNTYMGNPDTEQLVTTFADHPAWWRAPKDRARLDIAPVRATLDALLPAVAKGVGGITRALSDAQTDYHAAIFAAVPDIANEVAQRNQPDTHVTSGYFTSPRNAAQLAVWQTYTRVVTPAGNLDADHFADVVTDPATLDSFVKARVSSRSIAPDYQQLDDSSARCPGGGRIAIRVAHVGGTQLRSDKNGWQSIDASTAHITITCVDTFDAIAGHGGSANGDVGSYMTHPPFVAWSDWKGYGGYMNFGDPDSTQPGMNVPAAMAEQFTQGPGVSLDRANGGLLPYQDIAYAPLANEAPRITIEVERMAATLVRTTGLGGAGRMRVTNGSASGAMHTLSSAHAYFARPSADALGDRLAGALLDAGTWQRDDGKTEYPSTFSPYWQASLAPVSAEERAAAQAAQYASDALVASP